MKNHEARKLLGENERSVRGRELMQRTGPEGLAEAVHSPSPEAIRACIGAQECPFCGRGPFKLLAQHTRWSHGIGTRDLRDMAGLNYTVSICSPEHSQKLSERSHITDPDRREARIRMLALARKRGGGYHQSPASRKMLAERMNRIRPLAFTPESLEKRTAQRRKPHPCPVCGTVVPTSQPICCSDECRSKNRSRAARSRWDSFDQETKERFLASQKQNAE
jgi:hypothetical protein